MDGLYAHYSAFNGLNRLKSLMCGLMEFCFFFSDTQIVLAIAKKVRLYLCHNRTV